MKFRIGRIIQTQLEISIYLIIMLIAIFYIDYGVKYLIVYFSMIMHETGHISYMLIKGVRICKIKLMVLGIRAEYSGDVSNKLEKIMLLLAGPFVNFIFFIIGYILYRNNFRWSELELFISSNLCLGIFNLMPLLPLDGGNIMRYLISEKYGIQYSYKFMKRLTKGLSIIIILIGVIVFLDNKYNFSILLIGSYLFLRRDDLLDNFEYVNGTINHTKKRL